SPLFILVKGAVVTALIGLAFAGSAAIRRPLTRTLAVMMSSDHHEARRRLAERWRHPTALRVFRTLSLGWGALLLLSSAQQGVPDLHRGRRHRPEHQVPVQDHAGMGPGANPDRDRRLPWLGSVGHLGIFLPWLPGNQPRSTVESPNRRRRERAPAPRPERGTR